MRTLTCVLIVATLGMIPDCGVMSQELSDAFADSLIGGASCPGYKNTVCNSTPKTGCPLQIIYQSNPDDPVTGKVSGKKVTCGCVKKPGTGCSAERGHANLYACGSSTGSGSDPGGSTTTP